MSQVVRLKTTPLRSRLWLQSLDGASPETAPRRDGRPSVRDEACNNFYMVLETEEKSLVVTERLANGSLSLGGQRGQTTWALLGVAGRVGAEEKTAARVRF